ncbi:hypothetical protein V6N12_055818 [Hibiscus sabdariffa]|uniref:DUF4283 domain-containing protein n=1 Tax=Hibiscus sabdariffa TaxID=183260 RepID=A0ABR2AVT9_9ROSI
MVKDRVDYRMLPKAKWAVKVVEGRSYKDVLIGNSSDVVVKPCHEAKLVPEYAELESVKIPKVSVLESKGLGDCKPIVLSLDTKEKGWLNSCLIGQINAMYDVDFVQQMLLAEGFKVSVGSWYGYYAIITFEEEEQVDIFWDLKDTVLKPWFSDIDRVARFMEPKKLRIWVCIDNLPLKVWNEATLCKIGSCWGNVIRLDPDTANRRWLDVARILIDVKCLSDIPPFLHIEVDGEAFCLRIGTSEFEDDHRWIDDENLNGCNVHSSPGEYRKPCMEKELLLGPDFLENEEKQVQPVFGKDTNCSASLDKSITIENKSKSVARVDPKEIDKVIGKLEVGHNMVDGAKSKDVGCECKSGDDAKLFEVQVDAAAESKCLSGHSTSVEPILDTSSGLYSIKPKLITHLNWENMIALGSKSLFFQNWGYGFSLKSLAQVSEVETKSRKDSTKVVVGAKAVDVSKSSKKERMESFLEGQHHKDDLDEARASIEVCESLGLSFNVDRDDLLRKFRELERGS